MHFMFCYYKNFTKRIFWFWYRIGKKNPTLIYVFSSQHEVDCSLPVAQLCLLKWPCCIGSLSCGPPDQVTVATKNYSLNCSELDECTESAPLVIPEWVCLWHSKGPCAFRFHSTVFDRGSLHARHKCWASKTANVPILVPFWYICISVVLQVIRGCLERRMNLISGIIQMFQHSSYTRRAKGPCRFRFFLDSKYLDSDTFWVGA